MRFAVCDDQQKFVDRTLEELRRYVTQRGETFEGEGFTDPEQFAARCWQELFDAIVLDVEMPKKNGIKTAQEIHAAQPKTPIIFMTSFLQYGPESLKVNAFRYVLKQNFEVDFPDALDALWEMKFPRRDTLCLDVKGERQEFELGKILSIEIQAHVLILWLEGEQQPVFAKGPTLKNLAKELETKGFVRPHNSFLINMAHISHVEKDRFVLDNGQIIQGSQRYYVEARRRYVLWKGERL